ncbi:MAG: hypothetical protein J0L92_11755 [Deltaproteobacteria bacterium]|nr:hypothetical protein [Deltaproteobacteria bacterium]
MTARGLFVLDGVGIAVTFHGDAGRLTPFTHALAPMRDPTPIGVDIEVAWGADDDEPHRPESLAPSFFQGAVQVSTLDHGWLLSTREAWLALRRVGSAVRVEGRASTDPSTLAVLTRRMLFMALALAMREHDRFHAHAGLVRVGEGAWLLVGASGTGKTTTTLALAATGLEPLADDAVFLTDGARVAPLGRAFHLSSRTRAAFPDLPRGEKLPDPDREAVRVVRPRAESLPVLGIVTLERFAARTFVRPRAPSDLLGRLLEESAIAVVDGATGVERQLAMLAHLASSVPAVAVDLGPDSLERPRELRVALEGALGTGRFSDE